jgi:hypothetical protein
MASASNSYTFKTGTVSGYGVAAPCVVTIHITETDNGDSVKYTASVYTELKTGDGYTYVKSSGIVLSWNGTEYTLIGNGSRRCNEGSGLWTALTYEYSVNKTDSPQKITFSGTLYEAIDGTTLKDNSHTDVYVSVTVPVKTYYWDIDTYPPEYTDVLNQHAVWFNEYIENQKVNIEKIDNELAAHNRKEKGTYVSIGELEPKEKTYEVYKVTNQGGSTINLDSNGRYGHKIDGNNDYIYVWTRWKHSKLTLNAGEEGYFIINEEKIDNSITLEEDLIYGSNSLNIIDKYIPQRMGYKFKGWFDSTGKQVYSENGKGIESIEYWKNENFQGTEDLELYAEWEIQNITYVKDNNEWKLSMTYVKDNNEWKPAIMYVKTENSWKQSITK